LQISSAGASITISLNMLAIRHLLSAQRLAARDVRSLGPPAYPFLENLAVARRGLAIRTRRDARRAAEAAHEGGEIVEADPVRAGRAGAIRVAHEARGLPPARPHQVLMRPPADHGGAHPQEVKATEARLSRERVERHV